MTESQTTFVDEYDETPPHYLHETVPVGFKVLREGVEIPTYAKNGDAGFDLVAMGNYHISKGDTHKIPLGFALEIPPGYEVQIRPRGGKSLLWGSYIANSPGTVDAGYRGEICLLVQAPLRSVVIRKGDKIAQGVLKRVPKAVFNITQTLTETERGHGGFGHTGQ